VLVKFLHSFTVTSLRIPVLLAILFASISVFAQERFSEYAYLLRLQHQSYGQNVCVLLQRNGAFHLESDQRDTTRVSEGKLASDKLRAVEAILNTGELQALTQSQIEEPLLRNRDLLQINIVRQDHWQDLIFNSTQSQEPYRRSLQPLVRWLGDLHKLPQRELSEDAGKNNCMVPRKIVLRRRGTDAETRVITSPSRPRVPTSAPTANRTPEKALLRLLSMTMKSNTAHERCVLINEDGAYRTEQRVQKVGSKRVGTKIDGGKLSPAELTELQKILADPELSGIRHRRTSQMVLPMSGEMLQLQIPRDAGLQEIVLSSKFNRRDVPFFYSGDGDITNARLLQKFLAEHVENDQLGTLDPQLRNQCTEAP
jgi:hypothetical protein